MSPNECLGYDIKQYDWEAPVMLELSECRVLLHCHRSQVHSGPVLSMHLIELFEIQTESKLMTYAELKVFEMELFDQLTVCRQITAV